jgi:hypothetical protein
MIARTLIPYRSRSLVWSLVCGISAFWTLGWTVGCSSSSSGSSNPAQTGDDVDSSAPADGGAGSGSDATTGGDGAQGGDDASSPLDDASPSEAAATNAVAAGDGGAGQFCSTLCAGLLACAADAGITGMPCNCNPGGAALERTDFVEAFTSCVKSAVVGDCSDAGAAVENCQTSAAAQISPTLAAAAFCKNLEGTLCSNTLPDCLTNAGIYSDTTIAALSNCLPDAPDADLDGGCSNFANCLNIASQP